MTDLFVEENTTERFQSIFAPVYTGEGLPSFLVEGPVGRCIARRRPSGLYDPDLQDREKLEAVRSRSTDGGNASTFTQHSERGRSAR